MSCIYNKVHLTQKEFEERIDDIINNINEETSTVWIVDHKVALIPYSLFSLLKETVNQNELQRKLQSTDH
jgi:PHD/YefM family antitoxin component YafN of YafNO toxin-antitoxin module